MSVNPLDLQVVFTQMNQVGKQQSLIKENEVIRQDQASERVKKDGEKDAEDVPETKDLSEGPDKIKDQSDKKSPSNKEKNKKRDEDLDKKKEKENIQSNEIKDPNLGQNIDILG